MKKLTAVAITFGLFLFLVQCDSGGTGSEPIDETYAPAAPSILAVAEISENAVTISWSDNSDNERGFLVERAIGSGEYAEIKQTQSNADSFTENLSDNIIYRYRVTAYNNFGNSTATDEVAVKRPAQAEENIVKEDGATFTMGTVASVVIAPNGLSGSGTITAVEGVKEDSIPAEKEPNLSVLSDIKIFSVIDFTNDELTLTANAGLTMNYEPAMVTQYNNDLDTLFADLVTDGAYTQAEVDAFKLAAADLDIYYFNRDLGRWMKTRAVHDTVAGTLNLKTPYLGIYGIGFNLADKTGMSIENDEELQEYLKETWDQPDGVEEDTPEDTACAPTRGTRGYTDCSLCPAEVDGVTEIAGVPLGCNNCSSAGEYVDRAWRGIFTGSCAKHDCCYNHGRMTYGHKKSNCDTRFFGDLSHRCYKKHGPFIKINLGLFKIWIPNPFFLALYPACMTSASGMATAVALHSGDGHLVPYADQPCYDFLKRGVDCNIPRLVAVDGEKYGCELDQSIDFTSEIYNKEDRPVTYLWTATGGIIGDPGAANVTWSSTGVSAGTTVTITCTLSDGENSIAPISKQVLVYELEEWVEWGVQEGSTESEMWYDVAVDSSDNVICAGTTHGSMPGCTSMGSLDFLMKKYSASGESVWVKQWGTTSGDRLDRIVLDDSGNIYTVGYTLGSFSGYTNAGKWDIVLMKFDSDVNQLWTTQNGSSDYDQARGMAIDSDGNIVVVGNCSAAFPGCTYNGGTDIFLQKYDTDGNILWTKQFGTGESEQPYGLTIDSEGNIYFTGYTLGAFPGSTNDGIVDLFVQKCTKDGNIVWIKQLGNDAGVNGLDISIDAFNNLIVAGGTYGSFDGFTNAGSMDITLHKFNLNGDLLSTAQYGTELKESISRLVLDHNGNVVISGTIWDDDGISDIFIHKLDFFGNVLWIRQTGSNKIDSSDGLILDSEGYIYSSGMELGSLFSVNQGDYDVLLMKIKPE